MGLVKKFLSPTNNGPRKSLYSNDREYGRGKYGLPKCYRLQILIQLNLFLSRKTLNLPLRLSLLRKSVHNRALS